MNIKTIIISLVLLIITVLGWNSIYIIGETQRGLLLRFGEIIKVDLEPGLGVKIPFTDVLKRFDIRKLVMDIPEETYLTKDKEPLVVDSYAIWRIKDLKKFYVSTTGSAEKAAILLKPRLDKELRNRFGINTQTEVISAKRDELTQAVTQQLDKISQQDLGIEILDVRIKQIEYDPNVVGRVYDRMKSERKQAAELYRSEGREKAEKLKAEADKNVQIILANAFRESELIRGEGDATATKTYADAFNKDRDFYDFYRSLAAYKNSLNNKNDILLIEPDNDFFKYLNNSSGK